jgi:hypothetical protein
VFVIWADIALSLLLVLCSDLQGLLDRMIAKDPNVRATSQEILVAIGGLRVEARDYVDGARSVAPQEGWLLRKGSASQAGQAAKSGKLGGFFGGGPKWERVWVCLEQARLAFYSDQSRMSCLEAISLPSILRVAISPPHEKQPPGSFSIMLRGLSQQGKTEKALLLRPEQEDSAAAVATQLFWTRMLSHTLEKAAATAHSSALPDGSEPDSGKPPDRADATVQQAGTAQGRRLRYDSFSDLMMAPSMAPLGSSSATEDGAVVSGGGLRREHAAPLPEPDADSSWAQFDDGGEEDKMEQVAPLPEPDADASWAQFDEGGE